MTPNHEPHLGACPFRARTLTTPFWRRKPTPLCGNRTVTLAAAHRDGLAGAVGHTHTTDRRGVVLSFRDTSSKIMFPPF